MTPYLIHAHRFTFEDIERAIGDGDQAVMKFAHEPALIPVCRVEGSTYAMLRFWSGEPTPEGYVLEYSPYTLDHIEPIRRVEDPARDSEFLRYFADELMAELL